LKSKLCYAERRPKVPHSGAVRTGARTNRMLSRTQQYSRADATLSLHTIGTM
jgi:hypothetical protein